MLKGKKFDAFALEMDTITVLQMFLGKWKSHTRMAQPSEKFR